MQLNASNETYGVDWLSTRKNPEGKFSQELPNDYMLIVPRDEMSTIRLSRAFQGGRKWLYASSKATAIVFVQVCQCHLSFHTV